jgi:hypothetical protein
MRMPPGDTEDMSGEVLAHRQWSSAQCGDIFMPSNDSLIEVSWHATVCTPRRQGAVDI